VAARTRPVTWAQSAQRALDEVLEDIAQDSLNGAVRVLTRALEAADSLSTFAERGRVVPEVADPTLRELFVYDYRLLYRIYEDRIVIRAFLHGAREFAKWRREEEPEL
jgi:toxin ParE1/3/4